MSGDSFLITDDGEVVAMDSKDNTDEVKASNTIEEFDIIESGTVDPDEFQDRYGCSKEEYDWLIGSIN